MKKLIFVFIFMVILLVAKNTFSQVKNIDFGPKFLTEWHYVRGGNLNDTLIKAPRTTDYYSIRIINPTSEPIKIKYGINGKSTTINSDESEGWIFYDTDFFVVTPNPFLIYEIVKTHSHSEE